MQPLRAIKTFDELKILADARRLAILRLLMAAPASLTQLGRALGEHPAWIRHHLKKLEQVGLVEMIDMQVSGGFVEKIYRARARVFTFQQVILPDDPSRQLVVFSGSHDLALELLGQVPGSNIDLVTMPVGSLDGLVALRQGLCHLAGCHLFDPASGEYNTPYVRHLFPDRAVALLTLVEREQGLMVAPGNPRRISSLADLAREDITLVNRNRGSGTRLWLDDRLRALGIGPEMVRGYRQEVRTHTDAAQAIQQGRADTALGIRAAASQFGLDFVPLFSERYDLVIPQEQLQSQALRPLLDTLVSGEYRRRVRALGGYDTARTGDRLPV